MNNTFNAHSRIPYYDVEFALNETNEPDSLISLVGVIPSLGENNNNPITIATDANLIINQLMDRLNNQTLRSSDRITDPSYVVTLSYLLVALYLGFEGNVVSYIIDPSCKSDSYYKESVVKYIVDKPRAIPRRPIKTHKGQHLVDFTPQGTPVNYSEEYAESLRRQQREGKGRIKRIKTKKTKIHKKYTRKLQNHKKKSNTKHRRSA